MRIRCPDCNTEITVVIVEKFMEKTFVVNHETKEISPKDDSPWEDQGERVCHCGQCDTLNVDYELRTYTVKEENENKLTG